MLQIAYRSKASRNLPESELKRILEVARVNNRAWGITGMLMYSNGTFFQVLEGERKNLQRLYDVIFADSRHNAIWSIYEVEIERRSFPNWSMGFHSVGPDTVGAEAFFRISKASAQNRIPKGAPEKLIRYMEQFARERLDN